jgi:hypothetical protein
MGLILGENGVCGWCLWIVLGCLARYRAFHLKWTGSLVAKVSTCRCRTKVLLVLAREVR